MAIDEIGSGVEDVGRIRHACDGGSKDPPRRI
jgi:hypothetical protein